MLAAAALALALVAAPSGWRDDFRAGRLSSRWQWKCPVPGPTLSLAARPGWARISVPRRKNGYDHWIERDPPLAAPMLTTDAPRGNFVFEARIQLARFEAQSNFHAAMVVGFSPGYVLAWGPFHAPLLRAASPEPELWCEPSGLARFIVVRGPARDLFLRIVRRADVYELWYRRPGEQEWTRAGEYHAFAEPSFIGFMGKTFGDGPGMAFDVDYASVRLSPSPPGKLRARLTLRPDARRWPVDERRFGHFIEHMHRCIYGGLWAEILDNRKFTGAAPGGVVEGWQRVGDEAARFWPDTHHWYAPAQSQAIMLRAKGTAGIEQGPLDLRGDVSHTGYVVAKSKPEGVPLHVELLTEDGTSVIQQRELGPLSRTWKRLKFSFAPLGRRQKVRFRVSFGGPGIVWLGCVSLMPADNLDGWRRDVVEVVKNVRPPLIRWPGGNFASQYDWSDGVGQRDRRAPRWNRAWGGWEWNDVGTDEFIRLCELLGAEPYICANAGEGTPLEAASWLAFCNAPPNTEEGQARASMGRREPYGVKMWGLGNEMYGGWQHGHLDAVKYALKAVEMARYLRALDSDLELVLVGVEGRAFDNWNEKVVRLAGRHCDYLSVHHYTGVAVHRDALAEYARAVSAPARVEAMLRETWDIARRANGGLALPICFDEWNITRHEGDEPGARGFYCMREGLFAAEIFNALNRLGPKVPIACVTQTVNVLSLIRVRGPDVVPTPSYWVLKLFRDGAGAAGVPVEFKGPRVNLLRGLVPVIDSSVTLSRDGQTAWVFLVNRHASRPVIVELGAAGATVAAVEQVRAVAPGDFLAANDYEHPNAVTAQDRPDLLVGGRTPRVQVPPHSLVAVRLRLARR